MIASTHRLAVPALLCALFATACDSSSSSGGGGGGGGGPDLTPPSISAQPDGGDYAADQLVRLSSNEPATVYYTTDGSLPTVGGANTLSGPAPIEDIAIEGPDATETTRLLSYFGVDAADNMGPVLTKQYTIDKVVPQVSQQGADPAPIGILDSAVVTWSASDDGFFTVELGGDGSPGSGNVVDSGSYTQPGAVMQSEIPGTLLRPSSESEDVHVFVEDAAGNLGSAIVSVNLRGFATLDLPAGVVELGVAPHPSELFVGRLYAAAVSTSELVVVDTDTNEIAGSVALACVPTGLAVLPDGSRAYVGCAGSIVEIDTTTIAESTTIPVPNGAVATGLAATPDGQRVYFGSSDGTLLYLDTATQAILPTNILDFPLESCRTAITSSLAPAKGLVAWKGAGSYGAFVFDAATGTLFGSVIPPTILAPPGAVAVTSSATVEQGFVGDFLNRITRVSLAPPAVEQFVPESMLWGVAVVPGSEFLLLTHPADRVLEFLGTADFAPHATYDLGVFDNPPTSAGHALPLAIERVLEGNVVVTRVYVVQEVDGSGARVVRVPLSTTLI